MSGGAPGTALDPIWDALNGLADRADTATTRISTLEAQMRSVQQSLPRGISEHAVTTHGTQLRGAVSRLVKFCAVNDIEDRELHALVDEFVAIELRYRQRGGT